MNAAPPNDIARRARRGTRRLVVVLMLALVLFVYAISGTVLTALGEQLVHSDPLERVDVVLVLAPGLDRVLEAADIYRAGMTPLILLTRERRSAAEQMLIDRGITQSGEERRRQILVGLGVAPAAVGFLDGFVNSTADEARTFAEWARSHGISTVLIVTSPLHTGRSRLTFRRALQNLPIRILMRASSTDTFRADTWWRSRDTLRDGFTEWQKLVYYRLFELRHVSPVASPEAP